MPRDGSIPEDYHYWHYRAHMLRIIAFLLLAAMLIAAGIVIPLLFLNAEEKLRQSIWTIGAIIMAAGAMFMVGASSALSRVALSALQLKLSYWLQWGGLGILYFSIAVALGA